MKPVQGSLSPPRTEEQAAQENTTPNSATYGAREISMELDPMASERFFKGDLFLSPTQVKQVKQEMLGQENLSSSRFYSEKLQPHTPHKSATQDAVNFFEAQPTRAVKNKGTVAKFFKRLSHRLMNSSGNSARTTTVNRINIQNSDSMNFKRRLINEAIRSHLSAIPMAQVPVASKLAYAACEQIFERAFNNLLDKQNGPEFKNVTVFRDEVAARFETAWTKWKIQNSGKSA